MKIVIIHGTGGNPNENRFPRLKKELENDGHQVRIPAFPTPENQNIESRCDVLQTQVPFKFDEETILIWHSLWATYILNILDAERETPIAKAILVSGFTKELWNEKFDKLNKPFLKKDFNRDRISDNTNEIIILHGDNDPYVPISEAENLKEKLLWELEIIAWWGHLNKASWYEEFEKLLYYV